MTRVLHGTLDRIDRGETLRYLGYGRNPCDPKTEALISEAERELLPYLDLRACYEVFPVSVNGDFIDLGFAGAESHSLALHLTGCSSAVVFACTAGLGVDRLIAKYTRISPARAAVLQALGAAAAEEWCDRLSEKFTAELGAKKSRFSCGYGDLPLTFQREIFSVLSVTKRLGITLTDNCFMTPTKSVTAIAGIDGEKKI